MPLAFPKPKPRVLDRVAYKRDREARERIFRRLVWTRDESHCRFCHRLVRHTVECVPERGEVHHVHGRNVAPKDRCNPDAAVLLCLKCHRDPSVIAFYRRIR